MTPRLASHDHATILDYLRLLRRHTWLILGVVGLVVAAAVVVSTLQKPVYQTTAEVLLNRQNRANALTGTPDPTTQQIDIERMAGTQAKLARVPGIADQTLRAAGVRGRTRQEFLDRVDTLSGYPNSTIQA